MPATLLQLPINHSTLTGLRRCECLPWYEEAAQQTLDSFLERALSKFERQSSLFIMKSLFESAGSCWVVDAVQIDEGSTVPPSVHYILLFVPRLSCITIVLVAVTRRSVAERRTTISMIVTVIVIMGMIMTTGRRSCRGVTEAINGFALLVLLTISLSTFAGDLGIGTLFQRIVSGGVK